MQDQVHCLMCVKSSLLAHLRLPSSALTAHFGATALGKVKFELRLLPQIRLPHRLRLCSSRFQRTRRRPIECQRASLRISLPRGPQYDVIPVCYSVQSVQRPQQSTNQTTGSGSSAFTPAAGKSFSTRLPTVMSKPHFSSTTLTSSGRDVGVSARGLQRAMSRRSRAYEKIKQLEQDTRHAKRKGRPEMRKRSRDMRNGNRITLRRRRV